MPETRLKKLEREYRLLQMQLAEIQQQIAHEKAKVKHGR